MNQHAVLVSAEASKLDPWHDYAVTSPLLAKLLEEAGLAVDIRVGVSGNLPRIDDADLLVINAGAALGASEDLAGRESLLAYMVTGRPILAMHAATSAMRAIPEWAAILGGSWINGQSFHPPLNFGHIDIISDHPVVRGVQSFTLMDERYCSLELQPARLDLATHIHESQVYPLVWVRSAGKSQIVYDALGHDFRSYDSLEHRAIIVQAARYLTSGENGRLSDALPPPGP